MRRFWKPGYYCDGNGLYLQIAKGGSKSWVVRTTIHGRRHEIGVGGYAYTSLAEAREKAIEIRKSAREGGDPLQAKRERMRVLEREHRMPTFEVAARDYHRELCKTLTNEKHKANWMESLEKWVFPAIGDRRIDRVTSSDILKILTPIWTEVPERAKRTKQRIGAVMSWARAAEFYTGSNPADDLEKVLPKVQREQKHYAALPYAEVPSFIQSLRSDAGISGRLAFEFLILCAARTGEVIQATWSEINWDTAIWTRPREHMKAKKEHQVPLSARAIEILHEAKRIGDGGAYIFPGLKMHLLLSNMVFIATLKRMKKTDITPHGFRSSFRDWAEEKTRYSQRAIEMALAHEVKNKVEAAYLRTKLLEERTELMADWAHFATGQPVAKVVRMHG